MSFKVAVVLFATVSAFTWLYDASVRAAPFLDNFDFSQWHSNFTHRLDSLLPGFNDTQESRKGQRNYFGSQVFQKNIVYSEDDGEAPLYGSLDMLIGNSNFGDSEGTNVYAPILVQENITYFRKNDNAQYGASVLQADNYFPDNSRKNNIYDPIVIRSNINYHTNITNNSVLGADVKPSGHNHPPSQGHHDLTGAQVGLGTQIKEHKEMSKIIHNDLKTDRSSSK